MAALQNETPFAINEKVKRLKNSETYQRLVDIIKAVYDLLIAVCPMSEEACGKLMQMATGAVVFSAKRRVTREVTRLKDKALENTRVKAMVNTSQVIRHAITLLSTDSIDAIELHMGEIAKVVQQVDIRDIQAEIAAIKTSLLRTHT
eukprot:scaffold4399_cov115-Isochrysis_galbana.AAC.3